jgi:hypothetical protein
MRKLKSTEFPNGALRIKINAYKCSKLINAASCPGVTATRDRPTFHDPSRQMYMVSKEYEIRGKEVDISTKCRHIFSAEEMKRKLKPKETEKREDIQG